MEITFEYKYDTQVIQRITIRVYKKNGSNDWNPVCVNKRSYTELLSKS